VKNVRRISSSYRKPTVSANVGERNKRVPDLFIRKLGELVRAGQEVGGSAVVTVDAVPADVPSIITALKHTILRLLFCDSYKSIIDGRIPNSLYDSDI
jgi:hypothetical protein